MLSVQLSIFKNYELSDRHQDRMASQNELFITRTEDEVASFQQTKEVGTMVESMEIGTTKGLVERESEKNKDQQNQETNVEQIEQGRPDIAIGLIKEMVHSVENGAQVTHQTVPQPLSLREIGTTEGQAEAHPVQSRDHENQAKVTAQNHQDDPTKVIAEENTRSLYIRVGVMSIIAEELIDEVVNEVAYDVVSPFHIAQEISFDISEEASMRGEQNIDVMLNNVLDEYEEEIENELLSSFLAEVEEEHKVAEETRIEYEQLGATLITADEILWETVTEMIHQVGEESLIDAEDLNLSILLDEVESYTGKDCEGDATPL